MAAIESDEVKMVPVTAICEKLGYHWIWDRFAQRLTCTRNTVRLSFVQDNPFYTVNDNILQLPTAPVRYGGTLYLPVELIPEIFKSCGNTLSWTSSTATLQVNTSDFSILSVLTDKKQNGTLLTVTLSDSLPFDFMYYYPNLTLNFFKGTVDTGATKQNNRIGIVKSMSSVQFKESAQISVMLSCEIEEPIIDYVQDTRTVMVSLRPLKVLSKPKSEKKTDEQSVKPHQITEPSYVMQGIKTVVLDPGHGGKDPGAIGIGGTKEKDVVLGITLQLRDLLKKKSKLTVYLTRDKDIFIPLNERTGFANSKKADLFISVHANSIGGSVKRKESTKGYKIYFLSQAKNEEDKLAAMRENAVIELEEKPQNYSSLQNVLIDLAGNEYLQESQDMCILLHKKFDSSLTKKISRLHLGIGQANFWVLNGAYMPSVLIETGFVSNKSEEKLLSDKNFQKEMAAAIYESIVDFSKRYESGL